MRPGPREGVVDHRHADGIIVERHHGRSCDRLGLDNIDDPIAVRVVAGSGTS